MSTDDKVENLNAVVLQVDVPSAARLINIRLADILPTIKLGQIERLFCTFYLYAGLEICGRISQHNMGFD